MKTLGRILIVLLVTVLLSAAVYFIANGGSFSLQSTGELNGTGLHQGGGTGQGLGDGTGFRGGHGGEEGELPAGTAWLELLKNLGIVAAAVIVIWGVRKLFSRPIRKPIPG
jgi:hypothetical protein